MREILFRGKRKANKSWVYGGIVHQTDYYGEKCDRYFIIDGANTQDYDIGYEYEVIPETVGQYIGVKDENGQKVFEGDIVKNDITGRIFKIIYNWTSFAREDDEGFYSYSFDRSIYEVIGNIYDNPELLKIFKKEK